MNTNQKKNAAAWYYEHLYRDEEITPRPRPTGEALPAALREIRDMELAPENRLLPREQLFVLQARRLADYEDEFAYRRDVLHYFPTYQSLTDRELRGYFGWRTRWRRGEREKTWLSYAFLHIYELLNGVGSRDPVEGFDKLRAFERDYGALDSGVLRYLNTWLADYVVYHRLDPVLLEGRESLALDGQLARLRAPAEVGDEALFEALTALSSYRLDRSALTAKEPALCAAVFSRVYRAVSAYYAKNRSQSFADACFGPVETRPVLLFESAVFWDERKLRDCDYTLSPLRAYACRGGNWYLRAPAEEVARSKKLGELMRTVDSRLRAETGLGSPVQPGLSTKWMLRLIDGEIAAYREEKRRAEARRVRFDFSRLAGIRADAAETRERLIVDEEREEEEPAAPLDAPPEADDTGLTAEERRLLVCLLRDESLGWLREKGLLASVLADSINEKLYDRFADTVLQGGDPPEVAADYAEELKEILSL